VNAKTRRGRLQLRAYLVGGRRRFDDRRHADLDLATARWARAACNLLGRAAVIVALHVATGAAAGAASRSRLVAVLLGPILHLAGDRLPHQDFHSQRLEIASGVAGIVLLAARRGPLDPATLGAAASSAPDLEHVFPFLRPGSRKLFHDRLGWHRAGRFSASLQLLLAAGILGALIAPRRGAT
jgi:hypothetical protein